MTPLIGRVIMFTMAVRNFATIADIFSHSDTSVTAMAMSYAVHQVSIKSAAVQVSKVSFVVEGGEGGGEGGGEWAGERGRGRQRTELTGR